MAEEEGMDSGSGAGMTEVRGMEMAEVMDYQVGGPPYSRPFEWPQGERPRLGEGAHEGRPYGGGEHTPLLGEGSPSP